MVEVTCTDMWSCVAMTIATCTDKGWRATFQSRTGSTGHLACYPRSIAQEATLCKGLRGRPFGGAFFLAKGVIWGLFSCQWACGEARGPTLRNSATATLP